MNLGGHVIKSCGSPLGFSEDLIVYQPSTPYKCRIMHFFWNAPYFNSYLNDWHMRDSNLLSI